MLVGGKLGTVGGTVLQADAPEPPILVARVPGAVDYHLPPCRVLDDTTVLFISNAGLEIFGPDVHRQLTNEIVMRTRAAHTPAPKGGAVEGLLRISDVDRAHAIDVVFVHGLDGDARTTWHPKNEPTRFWPTWIAQDVPGTAVWSLGYEVSSSAWKGTDMPLADRATNALATLEAAGLGGAPIVFVCHSLGGLLVKQMLRHASDYGVPGWSDIARATRGIVFLSTPHSGSDISSWVKYL